MVSSSSPPSALSDDELFALGCLMAILVLIVTSVLWCLGCFSPKTRPTTAEVKTERIAIVRGLIDTKSGVKSVHLDYDKEVVDELKRFDNHNPVHYGGGLLDVLKGN
ncbi:hypothetical protein TrCOL_g9993 [Triparma columacea]|uniref:Uncharacterized protein n=1 Tax=Triparma columacea TaxID=722753 RepID=A0A9W7GD41_9STRA|nr:hypothetical protein TrCOL_g9993 [Triparma columacea]